MKMNKCFESGFHISLSYPCNCIYFSCFVDIVIFLSSLFLSFSNSFLPSLFLFSLLTFPPVFSFFLHFLVLSFSDSFLPSFFLFIHFLPFHLLLPPSFINYYVYMCLFIHTFTAREGGPEYTMMLFR